MIKFIKILISTCVLSAAVFAQTNTDDYKKSEFYVGYSNLQSDEGGYRTLNGFQAAYVRNIHKYFGLKADVSAAFDSDDYSITSNDQTNGTYTFRGNVKNQTYQFLGGIQFKKNNSNARFKPFAHMLAGVAVTRYKGSRLTCTAGTCPDFINNSSSYSFRGTNFAAAVGAGLDIKINDKVDFRAIQVDYNPIYRGGNDWQNNVRLGIGVVFK